LTGYSDEERRKPQKKKNQNCNEINKAPSSPVYHVVASQEVQPYINRKMHMKAEKGGEREREEGVFSLLRPSRKLMPLRVPCVSPGHPDAKIGGAAV
jgi:hypothetical protein